MASLDSSSSVRQESSWLDIRGKSIRIDVAELTREARIAMLSEIHSAHYQFQSVGHLETGVFPFELLRVCSLIFQQLSLGDESGVKREALL